MPLKKTQDQTTPVNEDSEIKGSDDAAGEMDPDEEDGEDDDEDWINDIGLHSNLRSKL